MTGTSGDLEAAWAEVARLQGEVARLQARIAELEGGWAPRGALEEVVAWSPRLFDGRDQTRDRAEVVDDRSSAEAKVGLFRSLFAGREDVYALRWESASSGRSGGGPAARDGWRRRGDDRQFLPLTDEVIESHLRGRAVVGLYPLMAGDTCRLLACDFDGPGWALDSRAYLQVCRAWGVPCALERSRSGAGGHAWTFFESAVPAASARALGAALLREAMAVRVELDLASYDRMFPSQDFLPRGASFGNLIALPLQGESRRSGATVFVDPDRLEPWPDQWAFLSGLRRMSPAEVEEARAALRPAAVGPEEMRQRPRGGPRRDTKPPAVVHGVRRGMVGFERAGLPPWLVADLKHLASVHNPEFYRREQQRRSTWNVPRLIRCYEEDLEQLWLPRGLEDQAARIVADGGSRVDVDDGMEDQPPIDVVFAGALSAAQHTALAAVAGHDLGVLVAPTGAGKTVMACALIAQRQVPTLVIVDRQQLADQWRAQLAVLLGLQGRQVGGRWLCAGPRRSLRSGQ